MENIERAKARLNTINAIEPLIHALRTISLGSWKSALNRKNNLELFKKNINRVINEIEEITQSKPLPKLRNNIHKSLILFIGSDRGLCGRYNYSLLDYYFATKQSITSETAIGVFGKKMKNILFKNSIQLQFDSDFPNSTCPSYAYALSSINQFDLFKYKQVNILYNHYIGAGRYLAKSRSFSPHHHQKFEIQKEVKSDFIFDTNPQIMHNELNNLLNRIHFYECLIHATASEHSTRFGILEEASRNIERLKIELTGILQEHRRSKITKEIQDLASAAGLISANT